jgi:methylenetetrahydrofolate dehydrogenase (NADP+) / methenyltetrahydrofolate cyclohydrolase
MMKIVDGKRIADRIKDEIVADILHCNAGDAFCSRRPSLAIVLVGERPDSSLYVSLKEREAKKVGVDTSLYRLPADAPEKELEEMIRFLNSDDRIDGILLQLPLPEGFDTDRIVALINPNKDVDRFHPENVKRIEEGSLLAPLAQVVLEVLDDTKFGIEGKSACIVANSELLGLVLSKTLENRGVLTKVASSQDEDLMEIASRADILITAVGKPGLIKSEHVKDGALIIDIGITKEADGKVYGDVDADSVSDKAEWLTPVPGGVGPITIAAALKNTLDIWKSKIE